MKTAAFETSAAMGGVAIGENGALVEEVRFPEKLVHARELIPTLDRLLAGAGWRPHDLERIAVSIGPGSFTGLRIGLAVGKVLALELETTLVGVDSIDVLAADAPFTEPFAVLIDARRESVYARFYCSAGVPPQAEGPFEVTRPERLVVGPALPLIGSGASAYRSHWPDNPLGPSNPPSPATLLALADHGRPLDSLTAEPVYGLSGVRGS